MTAESPKVVVVGSFVQDLTFYAREFPAPGESRIGRFVTGPGGKGFNQAIACHRQGVPTLFVGGVGDDAFARDALGFAEAEGMATEFLVQAGVASGAASVVVNERAENMIVVALGANDALSSADVERVRPAIAEAAVVLCQTECGMSATRRALELGRSSGAVTILNPAPINDAVDLELVRLADVLVPNETEFAFLAEHLLGERLPDRYWETERDSLHALCAKLGVRTLVLTLGSSGCFESHHGPAAPGRGWRAVPACPVEAVDTTGAGDAFSGGLAAGLVEYPGDFAAAVDHATRVAALSVTRPGTAPAMPSRAEVAAL